MSAFRFKAMNRTWEIMAGAWCAREIHEGWCIKNICFVVEKFVARCTRLQLALKSIVQGQSGVQSIENIIRNDTLFHLTAGVSLSIRDLAMMMGSKGQLCS